jgi:HAMP domain-containing protein
LLRDSVRYRWYIIVFAALIGVGLGVALVFLKPASFSSSTTVILYPISGNPYTPSSEAETIEMLQTEAVTVTSQDTASAVLDELNLDITSEELRRQTTAIVPANTQTLKITYTSTNRSITVEVVDALARNFLRERRRLAEQSIAATTESLETQLTDAEDLFNEADKAGADSVAAGYQADILDLRSQLAAVNALPTDPGRIVTPGLAPEQSGARHLLTFALAGLLVGALTGLAVALWRERRADFVRSAEDLADYDFAAPVSVINGPELGEAALRHLRMRLAQRVDSHGVVALVGVSPGTALPVSALVARSLAASGISVALIDGTGTEPGHADPLGYDGKPGLAEALEGQLAELPSGHRISDTLTYLPAGAAPAAAVEHLVGNRARTIIRTLAARSDITLVACVATDRVEGEALGRLTDGAIVVVELHRTSHSDLGVVLRAVSRLERPLLGVFVVPTTP